MYSPEKVLQSIEIRVNITTPNGYILWHQDLDFMFHVLLAVGLLYFAQCGSQLSAVQSA